MDNCRPNRDAIRTFLALSFATLSSVQDVSECGAVKNQYCRVAEIQNLVQFLASSTFDHFYNVYYLHGLYSILCVGRGKSHFSGGHEGQPSTAIVPLQEKTVIPFMEKTWLFWWVFAAFAVARWFHVLSVSGKTKNSDVLTEEEKEECVSSWFLHKTNFILLPETDQVSRGVPIQNVGK